ncbi:MAG: hypothetical protein PHP82_03625 [Candidatus ainarchaeum sp.]|nr:hypothetical protein [Candidatus ainarchaeum sp.]
MSSKKMEKKAQISLEYLIIITAFFSSLLIIIPSINFIVNDFLFVNDSLLMKQISEKISEQDKLFLFLSDGSRKEFEFVPAKDITLKTINNEFILSNPKKTIIINLSSKQNFFEEKFNSKFVIIIEKQNNETKIFFSKK